MSFCFSTKFQFYSKLVYKNSLVFSALCVPYERNYGVLPFALIFGIINFASQNVRNDIDYRL